MNQGTANGMGGWLKSRRCETAACVEMDVRGSVVLMRDSKDPDGIVLEFTREEWGTFCADVRGAWTGRRAVDVLRFSDGGVRVARADWLACSLAFTGEEWDTFMTAVRDGEFDASAPTAAAKPLPLLFVGTDASVTEEDLAALREAFEKVITSVEGHILRGVTSFAYVPNADRR